VREEHCKRLVAEALLSGYMRNTRNSACIKDTYRCMFSSSARKTNLYK